MSAVKKIVVIGSGASGICAAKHSLEHGYDVTVYEQTSNIGGLWVYTDKTGLDDYGLPVHTAIYQNLITNRPIETMGYPGFDFPNKGRSFVTADAVLEFLLSYVDHYKLAEKIKLLHYVVRVTPTDDDKWEVIVKNLKTNVYTTEIYDFVFICNGHHHKAFIPDYPKKNNFTGRQLHSREYRSPDAFEGENAVLIIGGGPSGGDLAMILATKAKTVYLSSHRDFTQVHFPENVVIKHEIKEFKTDGVLFSDGTEANVNSIIYCTGYKYIYPFLSTDAGIYVLDDFSTVHPVYKHCINISKPSMAFIGLHNCASNLNAFDMQVRLCFRVWNNEISLPSKEKMLEDIKIQKQNQLDRGFNYPKAHTFGDDQTNYFQQLAEAGKMPRLPEVVLKIFDDATYLHTKYPQTFRYYNYKIIDDESFERTKLENLKIE